jgi:putative redox protein
MGKASVTWLQKLQFVGTDSTNHSVVISAADEENSVGMKPSELLALSLASCTAYDVVNILQKRRKKIRYFRIDVEAEQQKDPPWTFTRLHLHYVIAGENISERDVAKAVELSHRELCSVSATLREAVELTHDYEIVESAAQEDKNGLA